VQPWLEQHLDRPLREGDVIVGGRREEPLGSELLLFGRPLTVYGKLGKTAVGTHERGLFITFATLDELRDIMRQICGTKAPLEPNKLSGVLLELAPGATTQQVRFAALANFPDIKVVAGESMLTSIRQGLAALLNGVLGLMVIMFVSTALMVSVLFSAIITERRRELGLLKAIGARSGQIIGMLLTEAALATALGGVMGCVLGVLLMRVYEHSLVYYLDRMGIPFVWLSTTAVGLIALACILLASLIGIAGALYPAWRASRQEPYDLIRSEGLVMLSCGRVTKVYSTERGDIEAVKGIDLVVPRGQFAAIVGRSGSGKSSLLAMIGGLSRPTSGVIRVDETDIWAMPDGGLSSFRNRRIGFVFQFASLLPTLRVIDNVALPALLGPARDAGHAYRAAAELLAQLGLAAHIDAYPAEISAGEQRRAVIARALVNAPSLLLADEPTSDLDEETEREIMEQFRAVNRERAMTLIMVTHNLRLAEQTDRVVHIADGRLVA
jgi:ABC-type lipoprotein export system ATPase subunit